MKKLMSLLIIFLISLTLFSQEKITEFNVTGGFVLCSDGTETEIFELEIKFQLYNNKLILTDIDYSEPTEFEGVFIKTIKYDDIVYSYQNYNIKINVFLTNKPHVVIIYKDNGERHFYGQY